MEIEEMIIKEVKGLIALLNGNLITLQKLLEVLRDALPEVPLSLIGTVKEVARTLSDQLNTYSKSSLISRIIDPLAEIERRRREKGLV